MAAIDRAYRIAPGTSDKTIIERREEAEQWLKRIEARQEGDDFSRILPDLAALFAEPSSLDEEPSDEEANEIGFQRVVFRGAEAVPIFGLLRTQPPKQPATRLRILVPSLLMPANSPSMLWFANNYYNKREHVLIVDSRGAGWTQWWSPDVLMTGGYMEGLDLTLIVSDLLEELTGRVTVVIVSGVNWGGTVALWCAYHAADTGTRVDHVHAYNAPTHLGLAIAEVQPRHDQESSVKEDWRTFFDILFRVRRADHRDEWSSFNDFRDLFLCADVNPDDLSPPGEIDPSLPRGEMPTIPGDLCSAAEVIRRAELDGKLKLRLEYSPSGMRPSVSSEHEARFNRVRKGTHGILSSSQVPQRKSPRTNGISSAEARVEGSAAKMRSRITAGQAWLDSSMRITRK